MRGLPDTSATHALQVGGWEHYGWGIDRHIAADLYDAITFNTEATGNWKKRPKLPYWPRPKVSTGEPEHKSRLRQLFAMFGGAGAKGGDTPSTVKPIPE